MMYVQWNSPKLSFYWSSSQNASLVVLEHSSGSKGELHKYQSRARCSVSPGLVQFDHQMKAAHHFNVSNFTCCHREHSLFSHTSYHHLDVFQEYPESEQVQLDVRVW